MTGRKLTSSFRGPFSSFNLFGNGIYLNTDGSVRPEDGFATIGGIARDRSGKWILGLNRLLGSCSVFEIELWDILDCLGILIDWGYTSV